MIDKDVWILAEQQDGAIRPVSYELLARGKKLADILHCSLCAILISGGVEQSTMDTLFHYGADKVLSIQHPKLKHFLAEPHTNTLAYLIEKFHPEILIGAATTTGRTIFPYVFARVHAGLTADCTELDIDSETGCLLQTRPAIGGNIMATIKTPAARPQMATVRPRSMAPLPPDRSRTGETLMIDVPPYLLNSRVVYERFEPNDPHEISIEDADIVVSGGKALRGKDNIDLIKDLANTLGGAVGTSRPPVDQGWAPYALQIGLSGKTIAPKLYLACGISGAIQHLAGMQTSETIVAINNDPNAQIFSVADFGIIGNMYEILPQLINRINETKSKLS